MVCRLASHAHAHTGAWRPTFLFPILHPVCSLQAHSQLFTERLGMETNVLDEVVVSIRNVKSKHQKLTTDLAKLQAQLESEAHQVDELLGDKIKRLKEAVLNCPPILVTISTPKQCHLNFQVTLKQDNEWPWISSCFFTHPGGYKLCLALKSTKMPFPMPRPNIQHTTKPKLFIAMVAVSQEDDDCRTWPCEGKATLRLLGTNNSTGDPFITKFLIEKSIMIQPNTKLAMSEIKDWMPLSEQAIPFGVTYHPGHIFPFTNIPSPGTSALSTTSIPHEKLDIRIETVVLNQESKAPSNSEMCKCVGIHSKEGRATSQKAKLIGVYLFE